MDDKFSDLDRIYENLNLIDMSKVEIPTMNYSIPSIESDPGYKEMLENLTESSQEKHERELENNKSLKALVQHNQDISNYNRELVSLNEKILNKINSLDDTLLLFNKAFNDGLERSESELKSNNALLLELITIIESKDEKKLLQFIGGMSGTIGIELLISYFKMRLGLTV